MDEARAELIRGLERARRQKWVGGALLLSVPGLFALMWLTNFAIIGPLWLLYTLGALPGGGMLLLKGARAQSESQRLLVAYEGGHLLPPARIVTR